MRCSERLVARILVFASLLLGVGTYAAGDRWVCPMRCEGAKAYPAAGSCPVCGMPLEKEAVTPAPGAPERDYRVDLRTEGPLEAGKPVPMELTLRRTRDGAAVTELERTHERLLHLIVVSQDLSHFAHEHPESRPDGSLLARLTFPAGGNYVLFSDFKPKGAAGQVVPTALAVDGTAKAPVPLRPSAGERRIVEGNTIALSLAPKQPKAGTPVKLTYRITRAGKPVADLEPYLGAGGHSVIVSADTTSYLHSHPEGHAHAGHAGAGAPPSAYGPTVTFETVFPRPGLYKAWAQFQRQGKILTVEHVLRVN